MVELLGLTLHEDLDRVLDESQNAEPDKDGDENGTYRVGAHPAEHVHQDGRHDDADTAQRVGQNVQEYSVHNLRAAWAGHRWLVVRVAVSSAAVRVAVSAAAVRVAVPCAAVRVAVPAAVRVAVAVELVALAVAVAHRDAHGFFVRMRMSMSSVGVAVTSTTVCVTVVKSKYSFSEKNNKIIASLLRISIHIGKK